MKNIIKKIVFEPLFQFSVLGGIFFVYFSISEQKEITTNTQNVIQISKKDIKKFNMNKRIVNFSLENLIQEEYYKRVLLNEAFILNLHTQDKMIVNKLLSKMQFIIDNKEGKFEPTEEELYKYYQNNIEDYSSREFISFYHIFFKTITIREKEKIYNFLEKIYTPKEKLLSLGDNFSHKQFYNLINKKELNTIFGKYFTHKIFTHKKGRWTKAIQSKEGIHFVYITTYATDSPYDFNNVIERVYQDYLLERVFSARKTFFLKMLKKYTLEIIDD